MNNMGAYRIVSSAGVDMGTYQAESERAALDAMARDAGYADQRAAEAVAGTFDGTVTAIAVTDVPKGTNLVDEAMSVTDGQIGRLLNEAGQAGDLTQVAVCAIALGGISCVEYEWQIEESHRYLERLGIIPKHVDANVRARAECARVIGDAAPKGAGARAWASESGGAELSWETGVDDEKLIGWTGANGSRCIETNGDPIFSASEDSFDEYWGAMSIRRAFTRPSGSKW